MGLCEATPTKVDSEVELHLYYIGCYSQVHGQQFTDNMIWMLFRQECSH